MQARKLGYKYTTISPNYYVYASTQILRLAISDLDPFVIVIHFG